MLRCIYHGFCSLILCSASSTPFQASRSTRTSCKGLLSFREVSLKALGEPTPVVGGTKLGGEASMDEGDIRARRNCASTARSAI